MLYIQLFIVARSKYYSTENFVHWRRAKNGNRDRNELLISGRAREFGPPAVGHTATGTRTQRTLRTDRCRRRRVRSYRAARHR